MAYEKTQKAIKKYILDFYQTTPYRLNRVSGLTTTTLQNLSTGKTKITIKIAVILEVAFPDNGMTAKDWLMLDMDQQILEFKQEEKNAGLLSAITPTTRGDK